MKTEKTGIHNVANSSIKVSKLERRPDNSFGPEARLGVETPEQARVQALLSTSLSQSLTSRATEIYLLEWVGDKVPSGARVAGKTIAWTHRGIVTSNRRREIGTYERLVEFGGPNQREHKMIVFVQK